MHYYLIKTKNEYENALKTLKLKIATDSRVLDACTTMTARVRCQRRTGEYSLCVSIFPLRATSSHCDHLLGLFFSRSSVRVIRSGDRFLAGRLTREQLMSTAVTGELDNILDCILEEG